MDRKEFSLARNLSLHSPDLILACSYDGFSKVFLFINKLKKLELKENRNCTKINFLI